MACNGQKPWLKWYPRDWRGEQKLRVCSVGARGLWMDLLCLMHEGDPYGHLTIDGVPVLIEDIASLAGLDHATTKSLMDELERRGVFSRNGDGVIYSRRMVRDEKRRKDGIKAQKKRKKYFENTGVQVIDKSEENYTPNGLSNGHPTMDTHNSDARCQMPDAKKRKRKEYPTHPRFDDLWKVKPNRLGGHNRKGANEIFTRLVEGGDDPDKIIQGAKMWKKTHERIGNSGTQFVPLVTTWLNRRGWEDDLLADPAKTNGHDPWNP